MDESSSKGDLSLPPSDTMNRVQAGDLIIDNDGEWGNVYLFRKFRIIVELK